MNEHGYLTLAEEVKSVVLERGWLEQAEIQAMWSLDADAYERIKELRV